MNVNISTWGFAYREVYWWVEYPENFSSKECFLPEILNSRNIENASIACGMRAIFGSLRDVPWKNQGFSDIEKHGGKQISDLTP